MEFTSRFIFATLFTLSLLLAILMVLLGVEYHYGDGWGLIGALAFPFSAISLVLAYRALYEYIKSFE